MIPPKVGIKGAREASVAPLYGDTNEREGNANSHSYVPDVLSSYNRNKAFPSLVTIRLVQSRMNSSTFRMLSDETLVFATYLLQSTECYVVRDAMERSTILHLEFN